MHIRNLHAYSYSRGSSEVATLLGNIQRPFLLCHARRQLGSVPLFVEQRILAFSQLRVKTAMRPTKSYLNAVGIDVCRYPQLRIASLKVDGDVPPIWLAAFRSGTMDDGSGAWLVTSHTIYAYLSPQKATHCYLSQQLDVLNITEVL